MVEVALDISLKTPRDAAARIRALPIGAAILYWRGQLAGDCYFAGPLKPRAVKQRDMMQALAGEGCIALFQRKDGDGRYQYYARRADLPPAPPPQELTPEEKAAAKLRMLNRHHRATKELRRRSDLRCKRYVNDWLITNGLTRADLDSGGHKRAASLVQLVRDALAIGFSQSGIGRALGKHPSTINRLIQQEGLDFGAAKATGGAP